VQKGDAPDAVELAQKSKNLTIEIAQAVAAKDFEKATNAATNVSRNCRTCHTFYKKE
jgi:cytochrome c2